LEDWHYHGHRDPGGKRLYSDSAIELCLVLREFYHLAYRQTQGFIESLFQAMGVAARVPDYTTLSRRAAGIRVSLKPKMSSQAKAEGMVIAVDSTGLSLYSRSQWQRLKHGTPKQPGYEKWRKLHVAINVATGEILASSYTKSTAKDAPEVPALLSAIEGEIQAVCGDMAYDTLACRRVLYHRGVRQLIPPLRSARVSRENRNIRAFQDILKQRDEAIDYIHHHTSLLQGDSSLAGQAWKKESGYHARSLVETTMLT
jgi:hypothetical protein